jgi:cell division protease FtsH
MSKLRDSLENGSLKNWALKNWKALVVLAVALVAVALVAPRLRAQPEELRLDQFNERLAADQVRTATISNAQSTVRGELDDGSEYTVVFPEAYGEQLTNDLLDAGVEADADNEDSTTLVEVLMSLVPTLIIVGVFIWFVSQMGGGGRAMKFGRAKARMASDVETPVRFSDVAGADEAVEELREVVEFLRDPARFQQLGARIPRGVLLCGPPGTGKTLLARAVAGEADVPFLTISGSDFVEMFVGVGASRVRDLFKQATSHAPAIVFVDEIDAVGRHRGTGVGGGHDEREQTLNQLLVEMDGFDASTGVILMAATNRPDVLDPALLRPGRFDRQVVVDLPDVRGRAAILEVHARNKPIDPQVDLQVLARRTPGFTGADLSNVLNEAALLAARRGAATVSPQDMTRAVDRVLAGPERLGRIMSDQERHTVAVHEAGHALVGHVLPHTDEVHKISIVSRGAALGYTVMLPTEDRHLHTRSQLSDVLAMTLGGRSAEEVVFGEITTGATDDIQRATRIARAMVVEYGMSEKLGPQRFARADGEPFLGREHTRSDEHSDELAARIDEEIARMLDEAHSRARRILEEHRGVLDRLAAALLERETLAEEDLEGLLADVGTSGADDRPDQFDAH